MKKMNRLLIIEDDMAVQSLLQGYLETQGFEVVAVRTAQQAFKEVRRRSFDLVLLDICLPDEDGLVVARRLLAIDDVSIMVVTARDDEETRIGGLEIGAEDFVSKPFHPRELVLRIKNILGRQGQASRREPRFKRVSAGPWFVDFECRVVFDRDGREIDLTKAELDILIALLRAKGRVLSRGFLLDVICSEAEKSSDRVIDVLISRIRKKLNVSELSPTLIVTVPGIGYKAAVDVEAL
jgi:DNA-binding response OmpR family regulator